MNTAASPLGLYIHVPFCDAKCPYCDFYSMRADSGRLDDYTRAVIASLHDWSDTLRRPADTLYFGGGTPSLLGASRLAQIIRAARDSFGLSGAEITVEANPSREMDDLFSALAAEGVNRLSIGLQSASDEELRLLGRRHTARQAADAVRSAQRAGISNISLDLMIATQNQTAESLLNSIHFCADLGVTHLSSYLLKIEDGTVYGRHRDDLRLPDDDTAADLYLLACEEMERAGYFQYEISNFAKPGFESRHNLKYWDAQEYLGIGPAAHSFVDGRRFFYPRSLRGFLSGDPPETEGSGGDPGEYAMLRLRLTEGLTEAGYRARFGQSIPDAYRRRAERYRTPGLTICDTNGIRMTRKGFLVSNLLLGDILG